MGSLGNARGKRMGLRIRRGTAAAAAAALVLSLFTMGPSATAASAGAGNHSGQAKDSGPAASHDTSPALSTIPVEPEPPDDGNQKDKKEHHDKRDDATL